MKNTRIPASRARSGHWLAALLAGTALSAAAPALASSQLALDQGCYSCHGEPPRRGARSLQQMAASLARYRGQPDAAAKLANQLRQGSLFGHIAAHERLDQQQALTLMQWLIDGAR